MIFVYSVGQQRLYVRPFAKYRLENARKDLIDWMVVHHRWSAERSVSESRFCLTLEHTRICIFFYAEIMSRW